MSKTTKPTTSAASPKPDGAALIDRDPFLESYRDILKARYAHLAGLREWLSAGGDLLGPVTQGHHYFGLNRGEQDGKPGWWYREWAPAADYVALIGDFNNWDRGANPSTRDEHGIWHAFFPDSDYADRLAHDCRYKVHVANNAGYAMDRLPAYAKRVVQDAGSVDYTAHLWRPPQLYEWKHESPGSLGREGLRIYEAHVGMSSEEGKVATFNEFTQNVLPRIADLGYNAVQLMAIQEHPYYGSFGYHVSNLYAVSSRFGTPDDLRALIDEAHRLGLRVIMDIVHSHMVKNTAEGLAMFDGSGHQYFHDGARGEHVAWDSKCFDYSKYEVLRLLLSNVRYWLEDYRFDGFRFDGVTSMLYLDHGLGADFDHYDRYFSGNVDGDALAYLALANEVAHTIRPDCITIAEDVSGMPGLARPIDEGGIGFDYRLAMGVPDNWIKLLKEKRDEDWNLGGLYGILLNRRWDEKHVGYAESHDQALVGDKTIAMWLMDKDLYDGMSSLQPMSPVIDRGLALHKMIRLFTFSLAGEGYLNFMGNEFGHPEWIDFPREGNGYSYHYARRQWSLPDADYLRYKGLNNFDRAMQRLDRDYHILLDKLIEQLAVHEDTRQLIYRRGPLVFAFNFHGSESYSDLRIPVPDKCDYKLVLCSDDAQFGGHGRIDPAVKYIVQPTPMYGRDQSIQIYLPSRTALVLAPA